MTGVLYTSPLMSWMDDIGKFKLHESMQVTWHRPGKPLLKLKVPAGFESDLASIPKRLQSVIGKLGHHLLPAIMHDAIYEGLFPGISKADADMMFLDGMKSKKVWLGKRWAMWAAVRLNFRGGHWD